MTRETIILGMMVLGFTVQALSSSIEDNPQEYMSKEDREILKEEARDMFYHAYNAYMDNAYPADELMPLSCKGRYRGSEPDRGDIDSTLGNFSLTLVDTLDTLVVLGDLGEFENAVRLVVKDVTFDTDVIVSLFETNIRMLGGLLSGHILSEYLQSRADIMPWYRGELLTLAKDLGYRFLPAFNTTTGIPFGRINLRHGMKGVPAEMCRETCTACAGSMILEMAALSRLTGESIFEDKAQKAMDALWKMRHRGTDLMGSVLNVHSGDWVRRDSGVGAGIDSYYEYCLKAYILLGDEKYLGRFNKHYQAVMKYVSQGPMLLDVHMHRPNTNSKNFMDALLAFWPGLQVLKGDIKPAVETHEMLYQVMQRHNFIPEAFTTDFQVHWGHHPLRPEFLESTYFLYRATGDHYYLGVGRKVLKSLQTYARVPCGYAAVSDVRTNKHDDTMDSFVLSETFKYLYLLFAEPNDLILDLDEFIFTTEGHLLPLTLASARTNVTADLDRDIVEIDEVGRTCPNSLHLFPATVRQPLRNMVEDVCPRRSLKRRLNASQFQANNLEHLKILSNMGITILTPAAGRVQVLHTFSNARTAQDAEEGLLFMQEMVELSKKQSQQSETRTRSVTYLPTDTNPPREVTLLAGPAHFGPEMKEGNKVTGFIEFASPSEACGDLVEPEKYVGKIVMVSRGNCMFVEKARRIEKAGAIAGIVLDTVIGSSAAVSPMFAMSGDGKEPDDVTIPVVFLFNKEATDLVVALIANDGSLTVTIGDYTPRDEIQLKAPGDLSVFERLKGSLKDFLTRQITPQNTASVNRQMATPVTMDVSGTTEEFSPVEYEINDCPLKALLHKKMYVVKIIKDDKIPSAMKDPKIMSKLEKSWYAIKQNLVNEIYEKKADSLIIGMAKIQLQYKTIHEIRQLQIIPLSQELSVPTMIRWFLKELCQVSPNLSSNDPSKLSSLKSDDNSNEQKSLRLNLDQFFTKVTKSLDSNVLETLEKIEQNLNYEINEENDEKNSSLDDYSSIVNRLEDMNEQLKDVLAQQFKADFPEFRLSLLMDMDKIFKGSSSSSEKIDLPNAEENEIKKEEKSKKNQEKIIFVGPLKGTISEEKGTIKIDLTAFPYSLMNEPTYLEGFEKTWYDVRQHIINVINAHEQRIVEIPIERLEIQYFTVKMLRGSRFENLVNLQNMVIWYLREISDMFPYSVPIETVIYSRREDESSPKKLQENHEDFAQLIADVSILQERTFPAHELSNSENLYSHEKKEEEARKDLKTFPGNSKDEIIDRINAAEWKKQTKNNEDERKTSEFESFMTKNSMELAMLADRVERINRAQSSTENETNNEVKNRSTNISENEEERKLKIMEDTRIQSRDKMEANYPKSEKVYENDATKFLIKEKIQTDDPLEEFKKPVWASEDGKDSTKSFSRFQEKPESPANRRYESTNERSNEYQSEYTTRTKSSSEEKMREGSKRIDDDL